MISESEFNTFKNNVEDMVRLVQSETNESLKFDDSLKRAKSDHNLSSKLDKSRPNVIHTDLSDIAYYSISNRPSMTPHAILTSKSISSYSKWPSITVDKLDSRTISDLTIPPGDKHSSNIYDRIVWRNRQADNQKLIAVKDKQILDKLKDRISKPRIAASRQAGNHSHIEVTSRYAINRGHEDRKGAMNNSNVSGGLYHPKRSLALSAVKDYELRRTSFQAKSGGEVSKLLSHAYTREPLIADIAEQIKKTRRITQIKEASIPAPDPDKHLSVLEKARKYLEKKKEKPATSAVTLKSSVLRSIPTHKGQGYL